jgi:alpha-beta hydrolase superfamily lysophospholipase
MAARSDRFAISRFSPTSTGRRLSADTAWNRSTRLRPPDVRGAALLIHGLTDSPYSMRALGDVLYRSGFEVTLLRLPGHGTLPSMMVHMQLRDWQAAVRLAVRDISARLPAGQPFYIGGYSTGGTLALSHALDAIAPGADPAWRRPDRVLLMSPAITLTPLAALTNVLDLFAVLPIDALEKVHWQQIAPEYDPYKFNSFPVNAARQVNAAARHLQRQLDRAQSDGRLAGMPPVLAWQSAVDATVEARGTVDTLFARLDGRQHRLVLFDVNRYRGFDAVQQPGTRRLIETAIGQSASGKRRHRLTVVTNAETDTRDVEVLDFEPGAAQPVRTPSGLAWPEDLVSLGHVALPFPPDDPVYGFRSGSGRDGLPSIGSWIMRGEEGAIVLPLGSLTRLRSNPFWPLVERQLQQVVADDLRRR